LSCNTENNETQIIDNPNEWIKDAIFKEHVKEYVYENFSHFKSIGNGGFGSVYRTKYNKNLE